ncbi:Zinc finger protein C25B8.19c [Grifola frondosa]|uniref:Zinc finger protein C25B8.19c n=1 Tax=Grifola frondosa TaxID=5627 RepID=A0A1C7LKY6_GRIFR|nr:Zinc finger protein C25B8.19c [Grifola frondosa]
MLLAAPGQAGLTRDGYPTSPVDAARAPHFAAHGGEHHPPCAALCCRSPSHGPASSAGHSISYQHDISSPYSFDVLRPHPLTAHLENVASSASATAPPRLANPNAYAGLHSSVSGESFVTSITKARPTFRVQLSPVGAPNALMHPENVNGGQIVPQTQMPYPPNYSANPYLSAPTTSGSAQSLQRLAAQQHPHQQQALGGVTDDKRHRCPHCHKRFNRPSSLRIHVNTHTGAKPFECHYPGCHRTFNVNSNMRRHYRNHLTARRRDVVARMIQPPSVSPSPPLSTADSYGQSPPRTATTYSPITTPRSPIRSEFDESDEEEHEGRARREVISSVRDEAPDDLSARAERLRLRSRSSPMPGPYDYDPSGRAGATRTRSQSCNVPGCSCSSQISTALRPAFPESLPSPSSRPHRGHEGGGRSGS